MWTSGVDLTFLYLKRDFLYIYHFLMHIILVYCFADAVASYRFLSFFTFPSRFFPGLLIKTIRFDVFLSYSF